MISFRYAALALLVTGAAPAMAQSLSLDYAPYAATTVGSGDDVFAPVDSLILDTGDNVVEFTLGFGFPEGNATPCDPGDCRAIRFTTASIYTVPATRTTPFVLTGVRVRYRTSQVSAATSTPPRVQYDSDVQPFVHVFAGNTPPPPVEDSLDAPGALVFTQLPLTTRTVNSTVDNYPVPQIESHLVNFVPAGQTTVPSSLVFQPGQSFSIRIQYFNIPNPAQIEAGTANSIAGASLSGQAGFDFSTTDLLRHNGLGVADTGGADGFEDQWWKRAISDNVFFPSAGETSAANRELALGQPSPNPAQGVVSFPFALREGGATRISIYDVTGRQVAVVADRTFGSGGQVAEFDASKLAAGVYVVVLEANGARATQRLSVVR